MTLGAVTPREGRTFTDRVSGATVHQLTDWHAHSHHLYFTNDGLWDGGRRLVIASERHNAPNLYSVELETGELTQLTDFRPEEPGRLQRTFVNPARGEAYIAVGKTVVAVNLRTLERRTLYECEEGFRLGNFSCTADGALLCVDVTEDLSGRIHMDLGHGYVGFAEYHAAGPTCRIVGVPTVGGATGVLHEEPRWISHVNTSPTRPDMLTFCHEGPWDKVEQRMWTLEISSGCVRPLRPQTPDEAIGHEYWLADGRRVGFHGHKALGGRQVHRFGVIGFDGGNHREWDFPHGSTHFHSLDETLLVGDGGRDEPHLLLWRLQGGGYEGPRILAWHRCSFHTQRQHAHPRMFRDAAGRTRVVFAADPNGYASVYIADVPEFESLPARDAE